MPTPCRQESARQEQGAGDEDIEQVDVHPPLLQPAQPVEPLGYRGKEGCENMDEDRIRRLLGKGLRRGENPLRSAPCCRGPKRAGKEMGLGHSGELVAV